LNDLDRLTVSRTYVNKRDERQSVANSPLFVVAVFVVHALASSIKNSARGGFIPRNRVSGRARE